MNEIEIDLLCMGIVFVLFCALLAVHGIWFDWLEKHGWIDTTGPNA